MKRRETLMKEFNAMVKPDSHFTCRDGREWDNDPDTNMVLWSGEDVEMIPPKDEDHGVPAFDYYNEFGGYEFGVYQDLVEWADKNDCYWEANDPGTFMLYRN